MCGSLGNYFRTVGKACCGSCLISSPSVTRWTPLYTEIFSVVSAHLGIQPFRTSLYSLILFFELLLLAYCENTEFKLVELH